MPEPGSINADRAAAGLPPAPHDPLTKDEVRQLLRECVTVVKPGEALVVRMANLNPMQAREYQQAVTAWHEHGDLPFKVFIFVGDELGTAPQGPFNPFSAVLPVPVDDPGAGFLP